MQELDYKINVKAVADLIQQQPCEHKLHGDNSTDTNIVYVTQYVRAIPETIASKTLNDNF